MGCPVDVITGSNGAELVSNAAWISWHVFNIARCVCVAIGFLLVTILSALMAYEASSRLHVA